MEEIKSGWFGLYGSILVCIFLHSPILKLTGFVLFIKVTVHPKFKFIENVYTLRLSKN